MEEERGGGSLRRVSGWGGRLLRLLGMEGRRLDNIWPFRRKKKKKKSLDPRTKKSLLLFGRMRKEAHCGTRTEEGEEEEGEPISSSRGFFCSPASGRGNFPRASLHVSDLLRSGSTPRVLGNGNRRPVVASP